MDELDRLLYQMPAKPVPGDLVNNVMAVIKSRQQRRQRVNLALSSLFVGLGLWQVLPTSLNILAQMNLPEDGFVVLSHTVNWVEAGIITGITNIVNDMLTYQEASINIMGFSTWLGMAILIAGIVLALGPLLRVESNY